MMGSKPWSGSRDGVTSRPSRTNSPICAIQPAALVEARDQARVRQVGGAEPQSQQVRGQEAGVRRARATSAKVPSAAPDRGGRVEAGRRQRHAAQHRAEREPGGVAADRADRQLLERAARRLRGRRRPATRRDLDQHDDEHGGERVVEPLLALQRGGQAAAQREPADGGEHGGGIRRRDDRADQQRLGGSRGRAPGARPPATTSAVTATPTVASRVAGTITRRSAGGSRRGRPRTGRGRARPSPGSPRGGSRRS